MNWNCRFLRRYLEDKDVSEPLPDGITLHLSGCRRCRREWQEVIRKHYLLERAASCLTPSDAMAATGQAALMERLRAESRNAPPQEAIWGTPPLPKRWSYGWAAGTLAVAGLGVILFWPRSSHSPVSVNGPKQMAKAIGVNPTSNSSLPAPPHEWSGVTSPSRYPTLPTGNNPKNNRSGHSLGSPLHSWGGDGGGVNNLSATKPVEIPSPHSGSASHARNGRKQNAPAAGRTPAHRGAVHSSSTDDLAYLNALPAYPRRKAVEDAVRQIIGKGDDFVTVQKPQLAATDTPETRRIVGEAVKQYEDEKAIVDERLFQKIDVELKGGDLRDLLDLFTQKSGVKFFVSKGLEDLKLTVLVKQAPVRDLMRQAVRLFNLQWRRRGEEGKYTYELMQDLKQKLAEEELKRKDDDQMLLNVVDEMEPYLQYKDAPKEQLHSLEEEAKQKAATAGSVEERRKWKQQAGVFDALSKGENKDILRVYAMLTPDQLVSLRNGQEATFTFKGDGSQNALPKEFADNLRTVFAAKFKEGFGDSQIENMTVSMGFSLNRDRPDEVNLNLIHDVTNTTQHGSSRIRFGNSLLSGEPDQLRNPDNAQAHQADRTRPEYKGKIDLSPQSDNPADTASQPFTQQLLKQTSEGNPEEAALKSRDWVDSAEILADLHQKTGRNVIADYYTRVYPKNSAAVTGDSILNALNEVGDLMQSEWQDDGGFVRFRRFNYYSERNMDVPNRLLHRWKASRESRGYLNLDDLSELAAFPREVIGHADLVKAVLLKYGLDEWPLAGSAQDLLRTYAALTPEQKQVVVSDTGFSLAGLSASQKATFIATFKEIGGFDNDDLSKVRWRLQQRPPGRYEWTYWDDYPKGSQFPLPIPIRETTREKAEAAVEALMRSKNVSAEHIEQGKKDISGPESGIWSQVLNGNRILLGESSGSSSRSTDVNIGGAGTVRATTKIHTSPD